MFDRTLTLSFFFPRSDSLIERLNRINPRLSINLSSPAFRKKDIQWKNYYFLYNLAREGIMYSVCRKRLGKRPAYSPVVRIVIYDIAPRLNPRPPPLISPAFKGQFIPIDNPRIIFCECKNKIINIWIIIPPFLSNLNT